MTCARKGCDLSVRAAGLCRAHYEDTPHGFVDSGPALERYRALRGAGLSCDRIAQLTGISRDGLRLMGRWTPAAQVSLETHERLMAVPVPKRIVDGGGLLPNVGTRRRLQALMWLGWRQSDLGEKLGVKPQTISSYMSEQSVMSSTAKRVADLFDELQLIPGPSETTKRRSRKAGFRSPLEWDEESIDNPDAKPHPGERRSIAAADRIEELRELGVTDIHAIAERLGIQPKSVERQLSPSRAA